MITSGDCLIASILISIRKDIQVSFHLGSILVLKNRSNDMCPNVRDSSPPKSIMKT